MQSEFLVWQIRSWKKIKLCGLCWNSSVIFMMPWSKKNNKMKKSMMMSWLGRMMPFQLCKRLRAFKNHNKMLLTTEKKQSSIFLEGFVMTGKNVKHCVLPRGGLRPFFASQARIGSHSHIVTHQFFGGRTLHPHLHLCKYHIPYGNMALYNYIII